MLIPAANDAFGTLGGSKELPGIARIPQLKDSALIRVQEVLTHGDPVSASTAHRAFRPTLWANAATVLRLFLHQVDTVADPVFNAGWPGRDQPSVSVSLLSRHDSSLDVLYRRRAASTLEIP